MTETNNDTETELTQKTIIDTYNKICDVLNQSKLSPIYLVGLLETIKNGLTNFYTGREEAEPQPSPQSEKPKQ